MSKKLGTKEFINSSKESFNEFFLKYLYGNYDDASNIVLSRGIWEDNVVRQPKIIEFALNITLKNQWIGYSDSLGHDNTFSELEKFVQLDNKNYTEKNLGITLGNVAGLNFVFQHLRKKYKEKEKKLSTLSVKPFYPSILDSISTLNEFNVGLIDIHNKEENIIFNEIEKELKSGNFSNILIPNFIGVDGKTYSKDFFDKLIRLCENLNIDLIIDEPTWFKKLEYPENINSEKVIRLVSLSKMYGLAGMKMGYLIGSEDFIKEYYNTASSGYGGPLSFLFLLQEFIYNFERNRLIGNKELLTEDIEQFKKRYNIEEEILKELYKDYKDTIDGNYKIFNKHYNIVTKWYEKNKSLFKNGLLNKDNPAINTIFELDENIIDFKFWVSLIKLYKTSVFPGTCIGSEKNTFRLNFLEEKETLEKGLKNISDLLSKYKKRIKEDIKFIIFDVEKLQEKNENELKDIFDTIKYKKINLGIVGENKEIQKILKKIGGQLEFTLIDKQEKIKNIEKLLKELGFIDDDVIYFRDNSEVKDLNNLLLLET